MFLKASSLNRSDDRLDSNITVHIVLFANHVRSFSPDWSINDRWKERKQNLICFLLEYYGRTYKITVYKYKNHPHRFYSFRQEMLKNNINATCKYFIVTWNIWTLDCSMSIKYMIDENLPKKNIITIYIKKTIMILIIWQDLDFEFIFHCY